MKRGYTIMKKCTDTLPSDYGEIYSLDLQKDKKTALIVNGVAIAVMLILFFIGNAVMPVSSLFEVEDEFYLHMSFIKLIVFLFAMIAYILLHELVHGITMKLFGAKTVKYGFTGLYAYAGCDEYFAKMPYIIIALAPIVIWGAVLFIVNCLVPADWFWIVYIIQIMNISGAAGDLFVTLKFSKYPKDILVKDIGVSMTVYSADGSQKS